MSNETSYGAGYPFAVEAVFAQRLGDAQKKINKIVAAAVLKTYRAIARSGAVINMDAADGKNVNPDEYLGEMLRGRALREAKQYLKAKGNAAYSRMTRAQQEELLNSIADQISPGITQAIALLKAVKGEGFFGDAPLYTMQEISQAVALGLIDDMEKTTGINGDQYRRAVKAITNKVQNEINERKFSLTDEYFDNYHQVHHVDDFPLTNITKNIPATPDTGGAVMPELKKLSKSIGTAASTQSVKPVSAAVTELYNDGAHNFQLIVRAAQNADLAPGITLEVEDLADLISIDIYEGDKKLVAQTADWLETTMGKMENVTEDAIQRGIKTMQQGLIEGRGVDHIAQQLEKEMEIPYRRARNVARNEIGNQSWNLEEANARRGNMRFYRWHGMLDERERKLHVAREDKAYDPAKPPSDGNPGQPHGCRCFPEWLFARADVRKAEEEIERRNLARLANKR